MLKRLYFFFNSFLTSSITPTHHSAKGYVRQLVFPMVGFTAYTLPNISYGVSFLGGNTPSLVRGLVVVEDHSITEFNWGTDAYAICHQHTATTPSSSVPVQRLERLLHLRHLPVRQHDPEVFP